MKNVSFIKLCLLASVLVLSCGLTASQASEFSEQNQSPGKFNTATAGGSVAGSPDNASPTPVFTDWSTPVNLGAPVNTPAADVTPFIAANGLDLLLASNREAGSGPSDLYSARRGRSGRWGFPISLGWAVNTPAFEEINPTLSADGQYLYFVSNRPGGCGSSDIYVSRRFFGSSLSNWSPPQNLGCHVNSVGVELAVSLLETADGAVYLYFSSGLRPGGMGFGDIYFTERQPDGSFGPVSPVAEFNTAFNEIRPNIRKDGLEIFFDSNRPGSIGGSPDLYVSTRACLTCPWTTPVNLGPTVNSSAIDGRPSLSYDGTELFFMSDRPGGFGSQDIYLIRRGRGPSLAFHSNRDGNNEIYVTNADGSDQTRLTNHSANDQRPDISPDGRQIVFVSNRVTGTNPEGDFEIFLMNSDGSNVRQLTFNNAVDTWPRFSPDGRRIAFHSNADGNFEIYLMKSDGADLARITNYPGLDQFPEWSPDGRRLAVRRDNDLYLINPEGSDPVQLTAQAGINQMASWSPDGTRIAFMSTREGYPSVFVMNADGSGQTNLTPKPNDVPASAWSSRAPQWRLNGQSIYFTALRPETGANENVWVMNSDGTGVARLTFASGASAEAAIRQLTAEPANLQ
jgi:Tol biopolymer transport system component